MKHYLILFCAAILFFSAAQKSTATVREDGVYLGEIEIKQERGALIEYHYIVFKTDGKADTYVMATKDIDAVAKNIKNNTPNYSGEYRINESDITYRSSNKDAKSTNSFTFYKGKINENGTITLEAMFADNTKSTANFEFQNLK
jgi:hypothetical protein